MGASHISGPLIVGGVQYGPSFGYIGSAGKTYFCEYEGGSDASTEMSSESPLKTLAEAEDLLVDGSGDKVIVMAKPVAAGTSYSTQHLAASLTWDKSATALIGDCAPTWIGQRSRITGEATGCTFTPLITISANDCLFENFALYHDYSNASAVCCALTGDRNVFRNVHFGGGIGTLALAGTGARSLVMTGAHENLFDGCVIGIDTGDHTAANVDLEFLSNCARNKFVNCTFVTKLAAGGAGHVFIKAIAAALDRETIFDNCLFINSSTYSGGIAQTNAMTTTADMGGIIVGHNSLVVGCTDIASVDAGVYFDVLGATANTAGLGVVTTRS